MILLDAFLQSRISAPIFAIDLGQVSLLQRRCTVYLDV